MRSKSEWHFGEHLEEVMRLDKAGTGDVLPKTSMGLKSWRDESGIQLRSAISHSYLTRIDSSLLPPSRPLKPPPSTIFLENPSTISHSLASSTLYPAQIDTSIHLRSCATRPVIAAGVFPHRVPRPPTPVDWKRSRSGFERVCAGGSKSSTPESSPRA